MSKEAVVVVPIQNPYRLMLDSTNPMRIIAQIAKPFLHVNNSQ